MRRLLPATFLLVLVLYVPGLHAQTPARPDASTADGGRYFGPLINGKMQGRGRIEWDSGARYEGEFSQGLYAGRGKLKLASGDIYEGEFRNGSMSGRGRLQMIDGSVYAGEFRKDYFNGKGRFERADGEVYEGAFKDGQFHGQGKLKSRSATYKGEFRLGQYWGKGEEISEEGGSYRGEFVRGRFHGKGRSESRDGEVYEGDFVDGEFTGTGTASYKDGSRYQGTFVKWRLQGQGKFEDAKGIVYEGKFVDGILDGPGKMTGRNGLRYEGGFKQWLPHGHGEMHLAGGDVYKGGFDGGVYSGQGTMTYAKPREDGKVKDSGIWLRGALPGGRDEAQSLVNVETALYGQRQLLDKALAALAPRDPSRINMYLLSIAGDGSQEVFRREVEFVRDQFGGRFGTKGRSLELINSRTTVDKVPMATLTSVREALKVIAAKMDKEKDILFLYLTSHGSREHELALGQNNMTLRDLPAKVLGDMLRETGIRWKVVVVSACYGGGFIDSVKNDHTLVMTAARHDRMSFGCSDDNDFTYFGRAFFKESLPGSRSFQEAFRKAEVLIRDWEKKDFKSAEKPGENDYSLPQMVTATPVDKHLQQWWAQYK